MAQRLTRRFVSARWKRIAGVARASAFALSMLSTGCKSNEPGSDELIGTSVAALSGDSGTDAGHDAGTPAPGIGAFALYATQSVELNASSLPTGCGVDVEFATGPFINGGVSAYLNCGAAIQSTQTLYADSVYLNSGATHRFSRTIDWTFQCGNLRGSPS